MILIDTSVLIDGLKGVKNPKTELLALIVKQKVQYGISVYTYQEVLQGARDDREYKRLKEYLSTQKIYFLSETVATYENAARMFYDLRRKGVTVRGTIDILIALTAIENGLFLLHSDRDFDVIAANVSDLKALESLV